MAIEHLPLNTSENILYQKNLKNNNFMNKKKCDKIFFKTAKTAKNQYKMQNLLKTILNFFKNVQ